MKIRMVLPGMLAMFVVAAPLSSNAADGPENSILDVATNINAEGEFAGAFDTLLAAVLVADPAVLQTLSGFGRNTLFAPTDAAFADIGVTAANVGDLPQTVLTQILYYHITQGKRPVANVLSKDSLRMYFGGRVQQSEGVLTDNVGREANVIVTDVFAQNGVIHAIDAVILPYGL
jgi:uncharacterized surface protein with fasciclin (FAS1) repeats